MSHPNLRWRTRFALRNLALTDPPIKQWISRARCAWTRRFATPHKHLRALTTYLLHNYEHPNIRNVVDEAIRVCRQASAVLVNDLDSPHVLHCSILAKPYVSPREKGILWVQFEPQLMKLALSPALPRMCSRYHILFMATWQPFYSIPFLLLLSRMTEPFFLIPSSRRDAVLCDRLGLHCVTLPFQSSSWVLPELFEPGDGKRDIDILMVANFSSYKRHWLLFDALRELPTTFKVVLAGRPWGGRTRDTLLAEAAAFGVADRVTIIESPSDAVVAELMSRARLLCALSYKEGSYVAVGEALMAGTPVGMYEDAIIGSKEYINPETGVLFRASERLAPQIRCFLDAPSRLRPERWARENISSRVNSRRLNAILAEQSRERGLEWRQDVRGLYCTNFVFHYLDPEEEERMAREHDGFESEYGIRIVRPPRPA